MKRTKWPPGEQARFLKRIGELLERGYPLAEAFESLAFYLERRRKADILASLEQLKEGYPLHLILNELEFDKDLVSYVYFAEQHGGMAGALVEGSEIILNRQNDYQRLKKLMGYPLFLFLLTGILMYFMDKVLLPEFTKLFHDMQISSNIFMEIVLMAASLLPVMLYILIAGLALGSGYYFYIFRKLPAVTQRARLARIPFAGRLFRLLYSHFFSVQLSYLFSGGLSVWDALKIFENNRQQAFSRELGKDIITRLAAGEDFGQAVSSYPFFESELSRIIKHGQENGKLDQELYFYSRHCLKQLEEKTDKFIKIIQPVLYSFIGLLVVSLYLAVLLPMFQLLQGI